MHASLSGAAMTTTAKHELVPQLQFPPGFRFVPTEEELVDVYLRAKIQGHKLPLEVVNDVSILEWQPGRLVEEYKGYGENRWFFFTVRHQSSSNKDKEPSRKVKVEGVTATWKATGSVQLIRRSKSKEGDGDKEVIVGTKRVLIYNSSDPDENGKWSMHEYILKGHDEIGQYALYSIQRKQHSDTEGNCDMDSEKKKKKTRKRKRTETETPCTELEGVPLPHPETTTLLAEPPLKLARKTKAQSKKKPSMQVAVKGEQKQGQSPMGPVTPPKKDELAPSSQQELQQQQQAAAYGAPLPPPVVLSAVPLQAVRVSPPSEPDGTLGASALKPEEHTVNDMSQLFALVYNQHPAMLSNNQGQGQSPASLTGSTAFPSNIVIDHAPFQPCYKQEEDSYSSFAVQNQHLSSGENQSVYMWQEQYADLADLFLMDNNATQPMNGGGWEHGDDQRHQVHQQQQQQQQQENNGGATSGLVQDSQPMNHHLQGGHGHDLAPSDEQSSGSDDLVGNLFGESADAFVRGVLDQDLADGTQKQEEGDELATLQAAGTQAQGADDTATLQSLEHGGLELLEWLQLLERARNEHVWNGPCSCMICAAGLWHYFTGNH